jgi:hypothetical protein
MNTMSKSEKKKAVKEAKRHAKLLNRNATQMFFRSVHKGHSIEEGIAFGQSQLRVY